MVHRTAPMSVANAELLRRIRQPSRAKGDTVDRAELKRQLGIDSDYLALRIFDRLDVHKDGILARAELVERIEALIHADPRERLRFAFDVHDDNGDGHIDRLELLGALNIGLAENRLAFGREMVETLADAIFQQADSNQDGRISFDEFADVLSRYPGVLEQLTLGDLRWLGLGPAPTKREGAWRRLLAIVDATRNDPIWAVLLFAYVAGNGALFALAVAHYKAIGANAFIQIARGCGACLNLHGALILVPMMRRTLTTLGRTNVGRLLIDDHVSLHRLFGDCAFYLAAGHTAAHLANLTTLKSSKIAGLAFGWAFITGALLLVTHSILWGFARAKVRRSRRFELFAWTHKAYALWLVLLLSHGPRAWMWMALPIVVFAIDRLGRRIRPARVRSLEVLPSGVTRVTIWRPAKFHFEAADYMFVRIAALSRSEWHPFTISSSPERSDALTLHVRSIGNWTTALHELASRPAAGAPLQVDIDGPYGTPSARIFESERVLLVAAGIGVTPFASVLSSLFERRRSGAKFAVSHVDFVWVCREQRAFEWFVTLLAEIERGAPDLFTIHIFMDSGRKDLRSTVLRVAMDALFAKCRFDLVTGLLSRTTLGAPDWNALVGSVLEAGAGKPVDAFYCGPPGLAKIVKAACRKRDVAFRQEHF